MIKNLDLSKSAKYLFASAITLLVINVLIDQYISAEKPELKKKSISFNEADSLFKQALKNYDLTEKFYNIRKNKKRPFDSLYSIRVYSDLPISLLLLELENLFSTTTARVTSQEESINGKTLTKIIVDDKTIITAEFIIDRSIFREKGRIGFVVSNFDFSVDNSSILNTPEQIIFLITPSENSKRFVNKILSAGKRYALLINDEIEDLSYKLHESYPVRRNKKSFENLFKHFPSAAFIAVDDNSDLFNSSIKDFLLKELEWRKAFYIKLSRFDLLNSYSSNSERAFSEMIKSMNKNETRVILIDSKNFGELLPVIPSYRKIGYKFVSATELLR